MKLRFNSVDIVAILSELQKRILGLRVINVYDIDNKTYLFKLAKPSADEKAVLLVESGTRMHVTDFEWPKNMAPSGFSMKMRKHIRNKRVESVTQLGIDRIIDIQFGTGEWAYHVIVELYDRGNFILTDHNYVILHLLRPRTDTDQDVKYITKEVYPLEVARKPLCEDRSQLWSEEGSLTKAFGRAKEGQQLRQILSSSFEYGPALLEHCLLQEDLNIGLKLGRNLDIDDPTVREKLANAFCHAEEFMKEVLDGGNINPVITYRVEKDLVKEEVPEEEIAYQYLEFHPCIFKQFESNRMLNFPSFNKTVDEFFSKVESQKTEMKTLQKERAALKKLENIQQDHQKRINELQSLQDVDNKKAQLIELNQKLVERVILTINHALANQVDWDEIGEMIADAKSNGDPVASAISNLKLDINHVTVTLSDPYERSDSDDEDMALPTLTVDIDLGESAFSNAKKYYEMKRSAVSKEKKTINSSFKALKSAEIKTKQMLKDVQTVAKINKVRKTMWFEKFHWFISSENYLVVAGRDQQQNEVIVKRYFRPGDIYVHADLHGASTVVVKNHNYTNLDSQPDYGSGPGVPPPKTLCEAGQMAAVLSSAWQARVVSAAWWVHHSQVTKTAPSGEYLTTGSFMIRGRKNFLPPCHLIYGFGFLFKLDEECVENHRGERRIRALDDTVGVKEEPEEEPEESVDQESSSDDDEEDEDAKAFSGLNLKVDFASRSSSVIEDKSSHCAPSSFSRSTSLSEANEDVESPAYSRQSSLDPSCNKKRLSAKERRELKKGTSSNSNPPNSIISEADKESDDIHENMTTPTPAGCEQNMTTPTPAGQDKTEEKVVAPDSPRDTSSPEGEQEVPPSANNKKEANPTQKIAPTKRRQKNKLKKIKEKYKDQDEEERDLKMAFLQSEGNTKQEEFNSKKNKRKNKKNRCVVSAPQNYRPPPSANQRDREAGKPNSALKEQRPIPKTETSGDAGVEGVTSGSTESGGVKKETKKVDEEEEEEVDEVPELPTTDDSSTDFLDSLTGCPKEEDILLYGIPVCAPYQTLLNYKFKVKLTPGNTKRGKAVKSALSCFLAEKSCTPHEKDLLRILKDQDLSRNFPGKVKISGSSVIANKSKKKS